MTFNDTTVLLLKIFTDVLDLRGKHYSFRIDSSAPVPESSLHLWRERGFKPSGTGVAFVKFDGAPKEYMYPAYFWSE